MSQLYESSDWSAAAPAGAPVFSPPFPGVNVNYVLTQDYTQNRADFAALALDTPHPDFADFLLAEESEQRDIGCGKVRWTRTYLKLPADYAEPSGTTNYTFPGFFGTYGDQGTLPVGRNFFTETVAVSKARAFFNTADPGADIAVLTPMKVYAVDPGNLINPPFLGDSPPFNYATTPDRTTYEALMAADAADAASYSLVAQPSIITRWLGNFWVRETLYVKAL